MCGITGLIALSGKLDEAMRSAVEPMNEALWHRGPNDDGYYHSPSCALAMRRLSIIDLEGGKQPLYNEDRSIVVFLNGEIYNYQDLKISLEKKQHRFNSQSDTEVLAHLYEEYGEEMFEYVKGMFACCIYDQKRERFIIARDRFGEKPLYYHHDGHTFSFSSELYSLLENKQIPRKLHLEALGYYFRTSLIPSPITLFQEVKNLPAGHILTISQGTISIKPYFELGNRVNPHIQTIKDAKAHIQPYLIQAVQRQSVSDVPLGAFLSGGIDSSTMVALLQQQSSKPIQTFNVRFEDEAYDESPIARAVAEYCGTNHHEITIPNQEFTEDIFWKIIRHVGQPFRDSSAIPTHYISQAIRQEVKVAISGDGGDEVFGGYDIFQWYSKIIQIQQIPAPIRQLARKGLQLLQHIHFPYSNKLRQLERAIRTSLQNEKEVAVALNEMFTELEIKQLLAISFKGKILTKTAFDRLKAYPEEGRDWTSLQKIMYYRACHTLPNNMLAKVDSMSMASSIEVRAPFLDADLYEAARQLPDRFLLHKGLGKYVIRELMKDQLPDIVFSHPKKGFSIPLFQYQNETFKRLAKRLLFEENPLPELFDQAVLERIYRQGLEMKQDSGTISVFRASHQLWMIMQLLGWAEQFGVELGI